MLINLLGQLNAIAQGNDALYSSMQVRQAQMGLVKGLGASNVDRIDLSTIARLHNKDKQLAFAGIKNDFIVKAMDSWYNSLTDKNKKH
ncbi:MAG: hypothetical protein PHE78_04605 [Candidatus Gastranaerophilales bacterium]|jgi:hypothetical protein|nr:hypothetical protein [Candidatus Gastranaerophilales bacterium]